jgi:hypothetical protein
MATRRDLEEIALALPEVVEEPAFGNRAWKVRKKLVVWERPLRAKEIEALGEAAPAARATVVGVRVPDEEAKTALLQSEPQIYFTTPHFDGHNSVLILLGKIPRADLREAIVKAWLMQAPKRLAAAYLAER